eukprot:6203781-Pleurochrysis_carterae.AAC.2
MPRVQRGEAAFVPHPLSMRKTHVSEAQQAQRAAQTRHFSDGELDRQQTQILGRCHARPNAVSRPTPQRRGRTQRSESRSASCAAY